MLEIGELIFTEKKKTRANSKARVGNNQEKNPSYYKLLIVN